VTLVATESGRTAWGTWGRVFVGLLVVAGVSYFTNPNHYRHQKELDPGPLPLDMMDTSALPDEASRRMAEATHPPATPFTYHDYRLVSTTTDKASGRLTSVGFFRLVFDLRS